MTEFFRTEDKNFESLINFNYTPNYHKWQDLRMHYIDEGPRDGPVMLLLHGMPTWSFLYRDILPVLVSAGYRCVAPDHMGFGRSDKPTDIHWYTIARHTEILSSLIVTLNLTRVTLVCQDWGGPIGLSQASMMPERFDHLVIMNTWLHHDDFEYSDALKIWNSHWQKDGIFDTEKPDLAKLLAKDFNGNVETIISNFDDDMGPTVSDTEQEIYRGFASPYLGLPDQGFNGFRRFPLSIPLSEKFYHNGNAVAQSLHYKNLMDWTQRPGKGCNFIWGGSDMAFPESQGRKWAAKMSAPFRVIPDAGHFLQNSHGQTVAEIILEHKG